MKYEVYILTDHFIRYAEALKEFGIERSTFDSITTQDLQEAVSVFLSYVVGLNYDFKQHKGDTLTFGITLSTDECKTQDLILAKNKHKKIDLSDIANNALDRYLYRFKYKLKKQVIEEKLKLNKMDSLFTALNFSCTAEKNLRTRVYYYGNCPSCSRENFIFSLDKSKNKVFVGCPNPHCKYYFARGIDLIGYLRKQYNISFTEALDLLWGGLTKPKEDFAVSNSFYQDKTTNEVADPGINPNQSKSSSSAFKNSIYYMGGHDFSFLFKYGFNIKLIQECSIKKGRQNNPIMYTLKGSSSIRLVITNRVTDALRIRKHLGKYLNIIAVHGNEINEEQLSQIEKIVPKDTIMKIAFDNSEKGEEGSKKALQDLRARGYNDIEICNLRKKFLNFSKVNFAKNNRDELRIVREGVFSLTKG